MRVAVVWGVGVVGVLAVAGAVYLLAAGPSPTVPELVPAPSATTRRVTRLAAPSTPAEHAELRADAPVPVSPPTTPALATLLALQMDRELAETDEQRAFMKFMSEMSAAQRQLREELAPRIEAEEPEALWILARAEVAMGDALNQSVVPAGLTEVQTASYAGQIEAKARERFDAAEALLDRVEAAAPGRAAEVGQLRTEIQAR